MNSMVVLQVTVPDGTVDEQVQFCVGFREKAIERELFRFDEIVARLTETPQDARQEVAHGDFSLDDQLDRFAGYWPGRSNWLRRIHDGLVDLGYTPILPEIRSATSKTPASYIRYVDAVNEITLGSINSGAFLFVGPMREKLRGSDMVEETRDGMRVQFDSDAKVDFILDTAREAKATSKE
jgi:hypothetical protein